LISEILAGSFTGGSFTGGSFTGGSFTGRSLTGGSFTSESLIGWITTGQYKVKVPELATIESEMSNLFTLFSAAQFL
jgi:hypothetical protein